MLMIIRCSCTTRNEKNNNGEFVEKHHLLNIYTDNEYQHGNKITLYKQGNLLLNHRVTPTWLDVIIFSNVHLCIRSDQASNCLNTCQSKAPDVVNFSHNKNCTLYLL